MSPRLPSSHGSILAVVVESSEGLLTSLNSQRTLTKHLLCARQCILAVYPVRCVSHRWGYRNTKDIRPALSDLVLRKRSKTWPRRQRKIRQTEPSGRTALCYFDVQDDLIGTHFPPVSPSPNSSVRGSGMTTQKVKDRFLQGARSWTLQTERARFMSECILYE